LQTHFDTLGTQPGILVGTQMLAKGHDLPNLTLVVVVGIDDGLFSADFRSSEKLAQLLIQVAGRAGRADKPGTVLLQTHHPDHALLNTLVRGGYHAFAAEELALREAAGFPPFAYLALLRAEARDAAVAQAFLRAASDAANALAEAQAVTVYPPVPATLSRVAGLERLQMLVESASRTRLQRLLAAWSPVLRELRRAHKGLARWAIDVDPLAI
jgi:primosomal protein N' (replication factor Y)